MKSKEDNSNNSSNNTYTALVTGASSGIGAATAKQLAFAGFDLILLARRKDRLLSLKEQILHELSQASKKIVQIELVSLDLTERTALQTWLQDLIKQGGLNHLKVLVNNAGLAKGVEKIAQAQMSDWDLMLETNVRALMYLSRNCADAIIKNKGHILNIGSVAGRWVYPGGAVYCATKFAVRAFSEGLRQDLLGTGVRVTNIEPGMVETEFSDVRFNNDKSKAKEVYKNMRPLTPNDLANTILWCVQQPQHVNIQELVVFPTDQAAVGQVYRHTT